MIKLHDQVNYLQLKSHWFNKGNSHIYIKVWLHFHFKCYACMVNGLKVQVYYFPSYFQNKITSYIPCGKLKPFDKKRFFGITRKMPKKHFTWRESRSCLSLHFTWRESRSCLSSIQENFEKGHFGPNPQSFIA